jgi:hypothetical protein
MISLEKLNKSSDASFEVLPFARLSLARCNASNADFFDDIRENDKGILSYL